MKSSLRMFYLKRKMNPESLRVSVKPGLGGCLLTSCPGMLAESWQFCGFLGLLFSLRLWPSFPPKRSYPCACVCPYVCTRVAYKNSKEIHFCLNTNMFAVYVSNQYRITEFPPNCISKCKQNQNVSYKYTHGTFRSHVTLYVPECNLSLERQLTWFSGQGKAKYSVT